MRFRKIKKSKGAIVGLELFDTEFRLFRWHGGWRLQPPTASLLLLCPHDPVPIPIVSSNVYQIQILEKCFPKLKTNSDGLPGYDGVGVFNVDGEPCVATIPGAFVA